MTNPQPLLTEEQYNVAMKDPAHLERWVGEARPFMVFVGPDLVKSLRWPDGHQALQSIIQQYQDHRCKIPSGSVRLERDPVLDQQVEVALMKDQRLSESEMDRAIRWLIGEIKERNPKWSLEDAPA